MRSSSTLSLFLFPLLVASLDTAVFWVIAWRRLSDWPHCWRSAGNRPGMMWMRRIIGSELWNGSGTSGNARFYRCRP
jgi:hypothetical protein